MDSFFNGPTNQDYEGKKIAIDAVGNVYIA